MKGGGNGEITKSKEERTESKKKKKEIFKDKKEEKKIWPTRIVKKKTKII